ncbi:hypothetical protein N8I77_003084 [Diaporthe amygdali]|uniref:Cytochrome P450 n=1 Tax=Phomopsis amygdali TaxID=1214568 RepID=A0AAD9SII2_PHOAM|nr:hypothetical protein N8I77_003084 [Diaporthe amygdali]
MSASESIFALAKYFVYLLIPYLLLLSAYRIFLHPLRRYPGPWLAKVTDAYGGWNALWMRFYLVIMRDHGTYGPVYRQGPNRLVFNTATALRDIYNNERVGKSFVYTLLVGAKTSPNVFNCLNKSLHRTKRKVIGQAVTERATRLFEPTLQQQVDIFIEQLRSSKEPMDITPRLRWVGLDTIGLLAFGFEFNVQRDPKHRFVLDGIFAGNFKSNCLFQFPLLYDLGLENLLASISGRSRKRFFALLEQMTSSRLGQGKHARNDLASFVAEGAQGAAMNDAKLRELLFSEGIFFLAAGGDTTAAATAALFFYITRKINSEAYKKLADEIRTTFASAAEIHSGSKLSGCHYLRACIDEAMRMAPPVPGIPWRQLAEDDPQKGQPLIIDGHLVPPGTQVGVSMYALHHNEKYFSEPYKFQPDRWLSENEAQVATMRSAFAPFSIGSRSCAGKAMAYLEASLVISKTIWHFDFEAAPGKLGRVGGGTTGRVDGRGRPDEYQLYDIFAASHKGPYLVFHPREGKNDHLGG